jgi:hypothetical protein
MSALLRSTPPHSKCQESGRFVPRFIHIPHPSLPKAYVFLRKIFAWSIRVRHFDS